MIRYTDVPFVQLPLANREAWQSLGNRFSGDNAKFSTGDLWALLGILLVAAALVWLLNWLYRRQQARRLSNEPRHLFIDLCRVHRLSRRDCRLLQQLSEEADLPLAAMVFVRPDLFDPQALSTDNEKELAAYERLAAKLFAGLDTLAPRPSQSEPSPTEAKSAATQLVLAPSTAIVNTPAPAK